MRIDPNVPISNNGVSERISESKPGGARPIDRRSGNIRESAQIGGDSANISSLATQLGNFPPVRQERVQALQQAVQSGSYKVDGANVAQSMLGELYGTGSQS